MTTTAGNTHTHRPMGQESTSHVLLDDGQGQLILERLRPWHRILARCKAARLDRQLAAGASPESSTILAARAGQLTSLKTRRALATSLWRILAAAGQPTAVPAISLRPTRIPLARTGIRRSAGTLNNLASSLIAPGPVPAQAVAMVGQLLADGAGPLYRDASDYDLAEAIENVTRALA